MEIIWDQTPRARWDRAAATAAWQQHWAYGAACAALGSQVLRAEVQIDGRPAALAQFVCRSLAGLAHAAVCTRGPVWLRDTPEDMRAEVYRALRRAIPLPRLRGVFMTPDAPAPERPVLRTARLAQVMSPYATATLDLTDGPETLRRAQHGKWRNRLVQAERAGLTVSGPRARPGQYDWLLAEEARQQQARRYAALPPPMVPAWQDAGGRDSVALYTAGTGGAPDAAMLFLVHGQGATYHIGWSSDAGRRVSAHNLLLWRAMLGLRRKGVRTLDLGGLNTEDAAGIARFKLGAGGRLKTLCGTWF